MKNQSEINSINLGKYPRVIGEDFNSPLWNDLVEYLNNPSKMNKAEYNLICSKRDISLWTKIGMKPHRGWKVSDAKQYFEIKGSKENLLSDFMEVWNEYYDFKKELSEATKNGKEVELTYIK